MAAVGGIRQGRSANDLAVRRKDGVHRERPVRIDAIVRDGGIVRVPAVLVVCVPVPEVIQRTLESAGDSGVLIDGLRHENAEIVVLTLEREARFAALANAWRSDAGRNALSAMRIV